MTPPVTDCSAMAEFKWSKQRLPFETHGRDVVLCENILAAATAAKALAEAFDTRVISASSDVRGTLRDAVGKRDRATLERVLHVLGLDDDALEWRLKDVSPLRRVLAAAVTAVANADRVLVFELGSFTAMPFDLAHVFRHIHALHVGFGVPVVVVIVDPALISSAGTHLSVLTERGIIESAPVIDALADPQSEDLLRRLLATPVPNPLAMQQRRVQRAATTTVNYAHTQIVQLPTADSIALAGGDVSG